MQVPDSVRALFQNFPEYKFVPRDKGSFDPEHEYAWEIEYANGLWEISNPLDIELACYRDNWNNNSFAHLKNAHHMLWPHEIKTWHDWTERRFQAHCENHKFITWAGGGNIGKSVDAAKLMLLFYLSSPNENTGLCGSTTLSASESRMWGYVKKYYAEDAAMELPGKLYLSNPAKICLRKTDTLHGIFSVPLMSSTTGKSASNLIGRHPKEKLFVVIDEGPDVPPGFMDAESNWEKSAWFQCTVIGNSNKMTDPHGILSKPLAGWDSINPDYDTEWVTKKGICLYFDCYKSPAIYEKDPEKKLALSKFLFTEQTIQKSIIDHGENSPEHWRMTRGFWPPESIGKNVLSPLDMDKHKVREKAQWDGREEIIKLAALDPSFTFSGDACILAFANLGTDVSGKRVLDMLGGKEGIVRLRFDVRDEDPIEYQIARQAREECAKRNIPPENFTLDVTGTGTGMGSIMEKEWSKRILKVSSIGECSDVFIDQDQKLTAKEAYDRRATEIVFALQRYVRSGQVKGLDDISIDQVCTREYEFKGRKLAIEKKEDYKQRLGRVDSHYKSPDEMDARCLLIELAWKRFNFILDSGKVRKEKSGLRKLFDSQYAVGDGPQTEIPANEVESYQGPIATHPASWDDGFLNGDNYDE